MRRCHRHSSRASRLVWTRSRWDRQKREPVFVSDVIGRAATPPEVIATPAPGAPTAPGAPPEDGRGTGAEGIHGSAIGDRIYSVLIWVFAICVPVLLALIAIEIFVAGWPALHQFGFAFLTSSAWDPVHGRFGAAPAIYGTLVSSFIALLLATPLALGVSVFLSEFAPPWLRQPVAFFV